ncbi:MAG TPA: hypothetical protein VHT26_20430, partial [Trebonia sp.]|nr:hypothetical protein [Trebonia sp.]
MTTTEDRARAAMRAIAGTVNDAPPLLLAAARDLKPVPDEVRADGHGSRRLGLHRPSLHLPSLQRPSLHRPGGAPGRGSRGGGRRRRWSVLAPVAAAVTIVALAVTLAVIRNVPNGGVAGPSTATPTAGPRATSGATATGVPEYYVAWMQADTPYLVVGNTFTGKTIATVASPAGVSLTAVYG